MIELETIWQDYGLDKLEQGLSKLFPKYELSLGTLLEEIMAGDIFGAVSYFFEGILSGVTGSFSGMKNILVWMVILGIVSALMTHFIEIFDKHQIADLGFYFIYLLLSAVLLQAFMGVLQTASDTITNIVTFVKLLIPTFLLSVGLATGSVTVGASYQLLLFLIYGVESVLVGVVLPMVYAMCMLAVLNGIWPEEKLVLIVGLLEKGIGWILKAALGVVTGFSIVQAMVTPAVDAVKSSVFRKAVSAIPGVGNAADGVMELLLGSAVVIKNSSAIILFSDVTLVHHSGSVGFLGLSKSQITDIVLAVDIDILFGKHAHKLAVYHGVCALYIGKRLFDVDNKGIFGNGAAYCICNDAVVGFKQRTAESQLEKVVKSAFYCAALVSQAVADALLCGAPLKIHFPCLSYIFFGYRLNAPVGIGLRKLVYVVALCMKLFSCKGG